MSKRKQYIPQKKYNPVVLSARVEELGVRITQMQHLLTSTNKSNARHVEYLSNFVRHDMKNAIQGLDGIIYNAANQKKIDQDTLVQLDTAVSLLRSSVDGFSRLIPSSTKQDTTLPEVLNAVEMLSRYDMQHNRIEARFDYDRDSKETIECSFQLLVQVLHNFIINACNACQSQDRKSLLVCGVNEKGYCRICVYDNGISISPDVKERIFEYGYSTTGGTGIGLFHARSVVADLGGTISVQPSDMKEYTKFFEIVFPSNKHKQLT